MTIANGIIEKSERFLTERGHKNPRRVNLVQFLTYALDKSFTLGKETNMFEVNGMCFEQSYGITKDKECVYVTIFGVQSTNFDRREE